MTSTALVKNRIQSIDIVRGVVMVIMALDHVRDYLHITGMTDDPLNLQTTTPALYFTRWITHLCAPIFVFLSGTSIYLMNFRKTKKEISSFLIKRGLWLMAIEMILITMGWRFDPMYHAIIWQVIWVIGLSMFLMGLLIWLPYYAIMILGFVLMFGHNLLDYPEAEHVGTFSFWWDMLHHGSFEAAHNIDSNHVIVTGYALIPWLSAMMLGYCFGKIYDPDVDSSVRKKLLLRLGFCMIILFAMVRLINVYGDPHPWTVINNPLWSANKNRFYTFLSFMKVHKYPPSLLYFLVTLGIGIIALSLIEGIKNKVTDFFNVFGRVPFFYYILHLYLIHTICVIFFYASGHGSNDITAPGQFFYFRPNDWGYSLWVVYAVWITVIAILYPLCKKYNQYKSTHKQWWLSYL